MKQLPEEGLLTLSQIIGQEAVTEEQANENRKRGKGPKRPRPGTPPIVPVKKTCWWEGVKTGRFPEGFKIGNGRTTFWTATSIRRLTTKA